MKPPIDKACGEGLMPDTLAALARLGIPLARLRSDSDPTPTPAIPAIPSTAFAS